MKNTLQKVCTWEYQDEGDSYWDTECGQAQYFEHGGVIENHYKYCPYCGGKIKVEEAI